MVKMRIRTLAMIKLLAALPLLASAQSSGTPSAADPSSPAASSLKFEAADVHASPNVSEPFLDGPHLEGDRYVLHQATLADLIANAYSLDVGNAQGGPSWLEYNRYDIQAKTAPTTTGADQKLMLQALLAERFKLVVHNGTAPMSAYVLKMSKDATKLKPAASTDNSGCDPHQPPQGSPPEIDFTCHNETMEQLAQLLRNMRGGGYLDKPVVDGTGLKETFDFELKWTPSGGRDRAGAASVSIFDALESQLGLKLPLETAPRPVLLVDSTNEVPMANPAGTDKALPPLPLPEFEVAVITPSKPDGPRMGRIGRGRLDATGMTLKTLIELAWDLNENEMESFANAPAWLDKDRWDIEAKMSNDEAADAANKPPEADVQQLRLMLQALLADRFNLRAHIEDRVNDAYSLIAVSPKLTPADPNSRTRCAEGPGADGKDPRAANPILNRLVTCQNMTMMQLGIELQRIADGYVHNTVLDTTGLKGSYNFTLSFSSVNNILNGGSRPPSNGSSQQDVTDATASDPNGAVSLFEAVRRELGLKMEKEKRPVPVLVIDKIQETPTPN
jgi:uncharacterized protein (TIGR03435 family)